MTKFIVSFALVATAALATGCPGGSPYYYGAAWYSVEETEYVTDSYGYTQLADCTGNVLFYGTFDDRCTPNALLSSDANSADLECSYVDANGDVNNFGQSFDFPAGYIAESCVNGVAVSNYGLTTTSAKEDTTKPQPEIIDGRLHATAKGLTAPLLVSKDLGKTVTIDEFLATKPNGLVRARDLTKDIKKIETQGTASSN